MWEAPGAEARETEKAERESFRRKHYVQQRPGRPRECSDEALCTKAREGQGALEESIMYKVDQGGRKRSGRKQFGQPRRPREYP